MHSYQLAAHEAGHAVVATLLGVGVGYATIKPSGDNWGHVTLRSHPDETTDAGRRVVARIYLAGWVAEELVTSHLARCVGGSSDAEKIESLGLGGWEIREARKDVKQMLCANWQALNDVTYALWERETLSGGEICDLMGVEAAASVQPLPVILNDWESSLAPEPNTSGVGVVVFDTSARGNSFCW
jgi:ATP-dependent Zn protease